MRDESNHKGYTNKSFLLSWLDANTDSVVISKLLVYNIAEPP